MQTNGVDGGVSIHEHGIMNSSGNPYLTPCQLADEDKPRAAPRARLPAGCMIMAGFGVTLINLFWCSVTVCMCGHSSWITTASALPSFLVLLLLEIIGWRNPPWERIAGLVFLLIQFLLLIRNGADILWFGHTPLLPNVIFGG